MGTGCPASAHPHGNWRVLISFLRSVSYKQKQYLA